MIRAARAKQRVKAGLVLVWAGLALLLFAALPGQAQRQPAPAAFLLHLDGAIGPASHDFVQRGLDRAAAEQAALAIIRIDTPGGLDSSMRDIIREILRSPVPVVTYVGPAGARAASAGTYILYASHIAAMTPGTNAGAATPVQLGGGGTPGGGGQESAEGEERKAGSPSEAKAMNDAIAYIRSLAELRGRNADWAEAAVRTAASISAQAALEERVIDIVAADLRDLLRQLDGRAVIAAGAERTLITGGMQVHEIEPGWRTRLLGAITNPNIALILMMIGVYGLFFEFMNPGALYPGTIGAVSLLTGLYALAALPVTFAGAGLILLGIALMVGEALSPSFGILGIGGAIAFMLGATILIDTDIPQFRIDWAVLLPVAFASLGLAILIARLAMRSARMRVVSGRESLVGALGVVLDWSEDRGHVFVQSERWRAFGGGGLAAGDPVRVTAVGGLILEVEPVPAANPSSLMIPPSTPGEPL